ncbi:bifunctional nuclease family protein [Macellibacteroides fermentans]|uniref:BFN domain-containing protein n=1 Tax=bioreactor metagenome TaxID=1076179 RepID=A0A644VX69_9ZZZZ|nr:bifunctional nuclease family protein [Macellibacteroides fermentans]NCC11348.1 bifunctional nuclease family protein [Bacteroidia bacterium]HML72410.1 bifunctional nuclease family protein [Macellibacteroides fermentans]HNU37472.1 bifunctional nuclease family protein [Macellibacteroides fermentans]HRG13667.1 bifunctional nuclease family protein [Macellibacteroides fermentans]
MEKKIKLRVQGLTNSQVQSGAYALILAEEDGNRRIPVIVGTPEAQSIAIALEYITPPRPLTHDLFVSFATAFDIKLKEVYIYKFEEGIFYSELLFTDGKREVPVDSRTSDAIAIALRAKCDIYVSESIMIEAGVVLDEDVEDNADEDFEDDDDDLMAMDPDEIKDDEALKRWLGLIDDEELNKRLEEAVQDENYEHAKMYQDEIRRRKKDKEETE